MPNSLDHLPSSGAISLQDIANTFYLSLSYADGGRVPLSAYYGDFIKYYSPDYPVIPSSSGKTINVDPFHGKKYIVPVPVTIASPSTNYNVYDHANDYTQSTYGLALNTPGIPFVISVLNKSRIEAASVTAPVVAPGIQKFVTTTTTGTWPVPTGVTSINIIVVGAGGGGGGGGGGGDLNYNYGGGGGGGGQVITRNDITVTPGSLLRITVGSGGAAGSDYNPGGMGGSSSIKINNTTTHTAYGGRGGGGGTAGIIYRGGDPGGKGGAAGGAGSISSAGKGGGTLASEISGPTPLCGKGGDGGRPTAEISTRGKDGAVVITWAEIKNTARDAQNAAAIAIGTSSDGSKSFNSITAVQLLNQGTITGKRDTTQRVIVTEDKITPPASRKNETETKTFTITDQGTTTLSFSLGAGGGAGGYGRQADNSGAAGPGSYGEYKVGNISVNNGDVIKCTIGAGGLAGLNGSPSTLTVNNVERVKAEGGAYNGGQKVVTSGGAGGPGGGNTDGGHASLSPRGYPGSADVEYSPNLPGGPAIYLTHRTTILNDGGFISGGTSSLGNRNEGAGHAIIGVSYLLNDPGGVINGDQV